MAPAGRRTFTAGAAHGYQARLSQFYHNTLRDDLMVLQYTPPAVRARQEDQHRAAQADDAPSESAPNPQRRHKSKMPRPKVPRSTAHNVPFVSKVTVHIRCREALHNKNHLLSALMALQVVTGKRAQLIRAKSDAAAWKLRKGMPIAAKVDLEGDDMFEFLDKLIEVVLPRMKEYHGLRMSAGDGNGSFTLGFDDSVIGLFPEMEMVYDMFPLVTGFSVNIATTAVRNPPGRLLLSGLGLPFLHARKPASEGQML
ncbi:ribosomal protein [Coemansia javaensis]|uniref:Ribosomal protein n=1 Tax=Coemansia javaensis TaxID=2761396 RepID=A0A9W8LIA5_9FUNG|nr:ribosomal protein [Coemansia javaensis]